MLRPGALLLKLRQKYQHGVHAAWVLDFVRPRVLSTPPVRDLDDYSCSIHVLTSANDWLNMVWALKSFYRASEARYALCIHDDGTLGDREAGVLKQHFPDARIIRSEQAEREVMHSLQQYPRCQEFRATNTLARKVFDFRHYLKSERMLLLDSDVLFFSKPHELLARIENPDYQLNAVNRDCGDGLTISPAIAKAHLGVRLIERFNSGLGVIHRDSLRLDWIEEFLAVPGIIGYHWRIEQTLFALCSSRFGGELLPPEYDVRLEGEQNGFPCRHYVGHIRGLMYTEGMRTLVREGFLQQDELANVAVN